MKFIEVHQLWAWVVVLSNAGAGGWALAAHRYPQLRHKAMWWLTIAAQLSVAAQAVLGVLVMNVDGREVDQLHVIYGFVSLASVGVIYSYQAQLQQWRYLLYGWGGLFLMGLGLRALVL